jgi:hypothetical protein
MKKYAVLDNGSTVANIIIASDLATAEKVTNSYCALIPLGAAVAIGYIYADGTFSAPIEEA